jgi:nicotinamidase/pyrazinamidase
MRALIVVDIQNDFLPGGALAVPEGDRIIPLANALQSAYDVVVASQDWHPADHGSFAANHPGHQIGERIDLYGLEQILWPVHCVQGTAGAEFSTALDTARIERIFQKGIDPTIDSYSALFDNGHRRATGMVDYLKDRGVDEVHLCGLATDYCVKFTALDARKCGFEVVVLRDACRGVNLRPGDDERALQEMADAGVRVIVSEERLAVIW